MTLREYINRCERQNIEYRLSKLKELGAPKVIIDGLGHDLELTKTNDLEISGDQDLLDKLEYQAHYVEKWRDGEGYLVIKTKDCIVNYFPRAKYGRFISLSQ